MKIDDVICLDIIELQLCVHIHTCTENEQADRFKHIKIQGYKGNLDDY